MFERHSVLQAVTLWRSSALVSTTSFSLKTSHIWISLLSLKLQIWCLLPARSSLTSRQTVECAFTLKLVRDMIITYSQMHCTDKYSQHSSMIWLAWLNGWVFVYELSCCGFESRCCQLILTNICSTHNLLNFLQDFIIYFWKFSFHGKNSGHCESKIEGTFCHYSHKILDKHLHYFMQYSLGEKFTVKVWK